MAQIDRFFFERYGLTEADLEHYLAAALSEGGEYADLYFEHTTSASILVDESLVKTATEGIEMGCGVRVLDGEQTGYAYTDDLEPEKILRVAKIAARIASGPARVSTVGLSTVVPSHNFYPVAHPSTDRDLADKLDLLARATRATRRREKWKSCSGPDGRASCCTRPLATVSKRTSTARASPPSAGGPASASPRSCAPSSTTAPFPTGAARSTWTTKASPPRRR